MDAQQTIIARNNVQISGSGEITLLFAHGFGCDQNVWRFIAPALEKSYRIVLFDYVGSGRSDRSAYIPDRYCSLDGYAEDIQDICESLDLNNVVLVEHSVSCMIGLLASKNIPERILQHVMLGPSPCFLNFPPDYSGGFERSDLEELLNLMDKNFIGWANYLAPLIMGMESSEALTAELTDSFCTTDPVVGKAFARATFLSDFRETLPQAQHPALILQSKVDSLASIEVGEYVHRHLPNSTFRILPAQGHCLHMTHPQLVIDALQQHLVAL